MARIDEQFEDKERCGNHGITSPISGAAKLKSRKRSKKDKKDKKSKKSKRSKRSKR